MATETTQDEFTTQRVVLDITVRRAKRDLPEQWNFYDVLDIDGVNDNVNVVSVETIALHDGHVEQMESE